MKRFTNKLGRQLLLIFVVNFIIILVFLGGIIPNIVKHKYEASIFDSLKLQSEELDNNVEEHTNLTNVAFIYIEDDIFYTSPNIYDMLENTNDCIRLVELMKNDYGTVKYKNHTYYFYKIENNNNLKISIMDSGFIEKTEDTILKLAIYILLLVYLGITLIISLWSRSVVKKIEGLKEKIDNIDNPNYKNKNIIRYDDELRSLDIAIDDMRISLLKQEELRTQIYQNISHDFKTPLTVIKSYIEAVEDGLEDKDRALNIILEQTNKLETKVHSLLYLNKLDYLKEEDFNFKEQVDLKKIINLSIDKFKHKNNEIVVKQNIDKNDIFLGTEDIWETIIDNILNNFYRYAEKEIKITIKNNKLILYNDGPNIDQDYLKIMFIPFRKGIKGEFGLGLSIVKKALVMIGYDIKVKNHNRKGVSFIISKKGS